MTLRSRLYITNNMKNLIFIKKEQQAAPLIMLVSIAGIAGVFLAFAAVDTSQTIIGILMAIFSALLITVKTEIYLDTDNNSILAKRTVLFIKKEKRTPLPEIQYIAVLKVKTSQNLNVASITTSVSDVTFNINLIFKDPKQRFFKLHSAQKESALKLALEISEKIHKPVLDNTAGEKRWLNTN
jgi:hypothetical protein